MKLPQFTRHDLFLLTLIIALGCGHGTNPVKNTANPTLYDLQGSWRMVSLCGDGEVCSTRDLKIAGFVLAVEGDCFTVRDGNGKLYSAGHLVIHESIKPTKMDLIGEDVGDKEGTTRVGIIRIYDGRLQWCYAHQENARPTGFSAPAAPEGSKATLAEFERF